ncbi:37S ribosomal protein S16, mitochondrial [Malassezia equina]|uniref:37S ribosomal protein S16, mitochondrial n=1 Tax=Malassezia equina TaxID=1381935 RepID=A0AAF0EA65_9BASI|nr:37S ribosomal protein S16, mitochondrial [Malassezia equina]
MVVRLRLARHGTRNNPFYHIVAIQNTKARNARPIEKLGEYDPVPRPARTAPTMAHTKSKNAPGYNGEVITSGIASQVQMEKRLEWNEDRIKYWLKTGAQPSKPMQAGLIPPEKRDSYKGLFRPTMPGAQEPVSSGKAEA